MKDLKDCDYLTPTEVAKLLMVSPSTVRHWAHSGKLDSLSTPGGHRRFLHDAIEKFASKNGISIRYPKKSIPRLLIVDDDKGVASFLIDFFGELEDKIVVVTAHDGFEAGSKTHAFKPDIVLLDLMLPGLDGFRVCRNLKSDETTKDIRVIAMTGYFTPDMANRIVDAGAETCLAKPIDIINLLDVLNLDGISNQPTQEFARTS